jgi:sugar lactone lactonase YvrE
VQDETAGGTSGGTVVTLEGNGLSNGASGASPTVTVGGRTATVTNFVDVNGSETVTFTTPAGTAGSADIEVTSAYGTATIAGGFQYVSEQVIGSLQPVAMVVDSARNQLYVADGASGSAIAVNLTTLATRTLLTPSAGAATGLAMTPDGTELLVLSYGGFSMDVVNLNSGVDVKTIAIAPGAVTNRYGPEYIAATARGTALVSVYDTATYLQGGVYEVDLTTGIAYPIRTLSNDFATAPALLAPSTDGKLVYMTLDGSLGISGGPLQLWSSTTDSAVQCCGYGDQEQLATDDAGDRVLGDSYTFDPQLRVVTTPAPVTLVVNGRSLVYGESLHSSGSLIYLPTTKGVEISDVHHGNTVLSVGEPAGSLQGPDNLAISHDGSVLYLAETNGLHVIDLNSVPLSIGSLTPAAGSAAGGMSVVLRGSGFAQGATVTIDGNTAAVQYVNSTELLVTTPAVTAAKDIVTVTNPGETAYSLDAAFDATAYPASAPVVLSTISPVKADTGQDFAGTLTGSGFRPNTVVMLNGVAGTTSFENPNQVQAVFFDLPGPETATVTAANAGTAVSNGVSLSIVNSETIVSSISPSSADAGSGAFALEVLSGGYFAPSSTVMWNGTARATTYLDNGQLLAAITAADVATVGTATVTVVTPQVPFGAGTSAAVTFTITPSVSAVSPSASTLLLGPVFQGATTTQTITLRSSGQLPVTISGIASSNSAFGVSNTCTAALAPGQTCTATITYAPTQQGEFSDSGTLTISSNATTPNTVTLAGSAGELVVSTLGGISVSQGTSGNTQVNLITYGYTPAANVALSCTAGLPAGATCSFSPGTLPLSAVSLGSNASGNTTLTITTTAPTLGETHAPGWSGTAIYASMLLLCGCGMRRRRLRGIALSLGAAAVLCGLAACGGGVASSGSDGGSSPPPVTKSGGTPTGTYTITVTATGNGFSSSGTVQLTVN